MAMTEAPFSFTTKVNGDLLTVRGATADEFVTHMSDLVEHPMFAETLGELAAVGGGVTPAQAVANVQAAMPGSTVVNQAPAQAAPQAGPPETETNAKGTRFTYNHPDAPFTPDGRQMLLMEGTNSKGAFKAWVDPLSGPRPAKKDGVTKAETQWIR